MASKVRFLDNVSVSAYDSGGGGDSPVSSSYATTASYAHFATSASHAEYAISASYEIVKEVSSSHADTASYVAAGNIDQPFVNITASGNISASGTITANEFNVGSGKIYGNEEYNNYLDFNNSSSLFKVQNKTFIKFDGSAVPYNVTVNEGTNNIDFIVKGASDNPLFKTDASTNQIGTHGVGTPEADFHIGGNLKTNSHITASGNVSGSATSTASFGTYLGDGSQLTGIEAGTNLTQSIFVSPSGNDGTAAVGNMSQPFQTILGATGSANVGDTIFVYPGTYQSENSNIIKDGVNYYFYPGAVVHPTASLSQWVVDIIDPTYPVNVRGAGTFISDDTEYGAIKIQAKECYFEFDTAKTTNNTTITFLQGGTVALEPTNEGGTFYTPTSHKGNPFYVKGKIVNTGNLGTYAGALVFGRDGINANSTGLFEGEVLQLHPTDERPAVFVRSNLYYYNLHVNARVFASSSNAIKHEGRGTLTLDGGTYSTGNPSSYYAVQADDGFRGNLKFESGDIYGGVKISFNDDQQNIIPTAHLKGNIYVYDSPDDYGIYIDKSNVSITGELFSTIGGNNARMLFATSSAAGALTKVYFGGTAIQGNQNYQDFCKIDGNVRLHWNGSFLSDASYATSEGNIIGSGSYLLIDSEFNPGAKLVSYGSDNYCFTLKEGGTLEIRDKVIWTCNQSGEDNGFVNVEGGKLILDGASLVNPFFSSSAQNNLGVAIYLNGSSHTGQILNNSFTNLLPFQSGSFTNEITGGGTLFQAPQLFAINDSKF